MVNMVFIIKVPFEDIVCLVVHVPELVWIRSSFFVKYLNINNS